MNRNTFFGYVRKVPFGGKLSPIQFKSLELILNYREENHPDTVSMEQLAYILATAYHESGMQYNREEIGGSKTRYAPWYGRGFVQLTWKTNYDKYGIKNAKDALKPEVSTRVLFDGMIEGKFTGKKLDQYFNENKCDPIQARRIVNGVRKGEKLPDKAELIRDYYTAFLKALKAAAKDEKDHDKVEPEKTPDTKDSSLWTVIGGMVTTAVGAVTTPYGLGALVAVLVAGGLYWYLRTREKNVHGI